MQADLFQATGPVVDATRLSKAQGSWMDPFRVTLRLDHLMIGSILALVLYVLVFSFGVEKGKRYAMKELRAERARQARIVRELIPSVPTPAPTEVPKEDLTATPRPLSGQFTIQLITFTNRRRAEEEVERLKKMGYQGFIIPNGKFFQVCAEAFEDMSEARQKLMRLKSEGFAPADAYIRPLNGLVPV